MIKRKAALGIALIATVIAVLIFPKDQIISPDSVIYIEGANSLSQDFKYESSFPRDLWESPRKEEEFAQMLTQAIQKTQTQEKITPFPPGTSILYSLTAPFGHDFAANSKILNIFLFFAFSFFLVNLVIKKQENAVLKALFLIFFFSTFEFTARYFWALSEPLFVLVSFGSFYTTLKFAETCNKKFFVASVILTIVSYFTRLQGIANIAAGALVLVLFLRKNRFRTTALWSLLAAAPFLANFLLNPSKNYFVYFYPETIKNAANLLYYYATNWLKYFVLFDPQSATQNAIYKVCAIFILGLFIAKIATSKNIKFWAAMIYFLSLNVVTFLSVVFLNVVGPVRYLMPIFPFLAYALFISAQGERKSIKILIGIMLAIIIPFKITAYFSHDFKQENLTNLVDQRHQMVAPLEEIKNDGGGGGSGSEKIFLSNDSMLAYGAMYYDEKAIYPLPYTKKGLDEFLNSLATASQRNQIEIIWKIANAGLPIFDKTSKKFVNYEYDEAYLGAKLNEKSQQGVQQKWQGNYIFYTSIFENK